jgi:hypothetical protein
MNHIPVHPNTVKPFINMMLFSMRHGLTGNALVESSDALLDLLNLSLEPFNCSASPFKATAALTKTLDSVVYRWSTEVIGPFLQGSTSVTLAFELVPQENRWQASATFNPGTHGQSDIFDVLKDESIQGDGFVYQLVHSVAHRANIRLVQERLSQDQKVTLSTHSLYQSLQGNQGATRYTEQDLALKLDGNPLEPRCSLFAKDTVGIKQVASDLDEIAVANVSDHGYVTLRTPAGDQFTLNADEAISAIPELQV